MGIFMMQVMGLEGSQRRRNRHGLWNARDNHGELLERVLEVGFIPYPCKKTKTEVRYQYDFLPWRTRFSWSPFRRSYEGCCNGALFGWSYWTWSPFGTGNGPWIESTLTYFSDSPIGSVTPCPFNKGTTSQPVTLSEVASGSIAATEIAEEQLENHGCACV
jgi:hypothetical protein